MKFANPFDREFWIEDEPDRKVVQFPGTLPTLQDPECALANEQAAGELLHGLTDVELAAHITILQADHKTKRHALYMSANALARALNERVRRRG